MGLEGLASAHSGPITIVVPKEMAQTNNDIRGTLHLSSKGYVYSPGSRRLVWWKFTALCVYLPLHQLTCTISQVFRSVFSDADPRGLKEYSRHLASLKEIAWRALAADNQDDLISFVEEFAFAELKYNCSSVGGKPSNVGQELAKKRSERLASGSYIAPCMQPLFHKNEYIEGSASRLNALEQDIASLESDLRLVSAAAGKNETSPAVGFGLWQSISNIFDTNPYSKKSESELQSLRQFFEWQRAAKMALLKEAKIKHLKSEQCEKYARIAVLAQMGMLGHIKDATVVTREVTCCGSVCYRDDQVCGILHRIECCASRCWALDCFCYFCCIWPEAGVACCC